MDHDSNCRAVVLTAIIDEHPGIMQITDQISVHNFDGTN